MRTSWMRRRAVARAAIVALTAGLAVLAGLAVVSTQNTERATARLAAAEAITQQWGAVFLEIGTEFENLVRFERATDDSGRSALIYSIGSAEDNLRWLHANGGDSDSFQARSLQNTYAGYSFTLRTMVDAQSRGDLTEMRAAAARASTSASALRRQAQENIARNAASISTLLEQTERDNKRLLLAVEVWSAIDLVLVVFCAFVLVAYQRGTERQARESKHQASHDGLTGLANRGLLNDRLDRAIADAESAGSGVGLLLLDLDRFKEVNDTLGHHAGDLLIQEVAARLSGAARGGDTVARLGGDEFALVLPDVRSTDDLLRLGRRILDAVCGPAAPAGVPVDVSASIGAALFPSPSTTGAELLQHADVAMYTAKRGHLGVALYDPGADENTTERLAVVGDLRRAIDNGELELFYQPKVRVADRTVCGVEALARWRHPVRGLLGPERFVEVAEQSGLIRPLTDRVLALALAQQREWLAAGRRVPVAVNVGADCLLDPSLPGRLRAMISEHGTAPGDLTVEITESAVIADPDRAAVVLAEIRAIGVRVSIDDFGTGYSSMSYLQEMPLDELKIDRRFTLRVEESGRGRAIVAAITDLAHALDLEVVVEGVEDEATLTVLTGVGCESAQGFLFSRPVPGGEVLAWIAEAEPVAI